mgnify:CR=1 FL=1
MSAAWAEVNGSAGQLSWNNLQSKCYTIYLMEWRYLQWTCKAAFSSASIGLWLSAKSSNSWNIDIIQQHWQHPSSLTTWATLTTPINMRATVTASVMREGLRVLHSYMTWGCRARIPFLRGPLSSCPSSHSASSWERWTKWLPLDLRAEWMQCVMRWKLTTVKGDWTYELLIQMSAGSSISPLV